MYDFSGRVQNVPFEFLRGQYVFERLRKRRLENNNEKTFHLNNNGKTFHLNNNEKTFQTFQNIINEKLSKTKEEILDVGLNNINNNIDNINNNIDIINNNNEKTFQIFKNEISETLSKTKEEILDVRLNLNLIEVNSIKNINEEILNLQNLIEVNNLEKINKEILKSQSIRSIDRSVRSIDQSIGSLVALLPIESPEFSRNLRFSLRFSCSSMANIMIKCKGESNEINEMNESVVFEQTFLIGLYIIEGIITNSYTGLDCTINSPFVESRRLPFDKIKTIELHSTDSTGTVIVQETTVFNAETVVFTKHN